MEPNSKLLRKSQVDLRPPRPHKPPRYRLSQIVERMEANAANYIMFQRGRGEWVRIPHDRVCAQVKFLIAGLKEHGVPLGPDFTCAIMGNSGYSWVLASLACIFTGTKIITVPETLREPDVNALLAPFRIDSAIVSGVFTRYAAFAQVACIELEAVESMASSGNSNDAIPIAPQFRALTFTSGSTSGHNLKAFWCEAEGTEVYMESFLSAFSLNGNDMWAVCHSLSHIVHLEKVLGGLVWGYNVALVRPTDLLVRHDAFSPSGLTTTPAVWEELANKLRGMLPTKGPRAALIAFILKWPINRFTRRLSGLLSRFVMPETRQLLGNRLKVAIIGTAPSRSELKRFLTLAGLPLFEGYGMSEIGLIAINTPQEYRFGSVGRPFPGIGVTIGAAGDIWVTTAFRRASCYENLPQDESEAVFAGERILCTGDLGRIDKDGYLFVEGRTKTLIITNRGEKINPISIELRLQELPGVEFAVVYGDNQPYLSAVLSARCADRDLAADDVRKYISFINGSLPHQHKIGNFVIADEPFSAANGLLTRVGKPNRSAIWQSYGPRLDQNHHEANS